MQYLFSVIIPVFNSEKYLRESINSILRQKKNNVEIILVNDCSADESGKICNFFQKEYSFVKVLHHKKNLGVGASRNNGIHISKGKYLIFLDSDDSLLSGSFQGLEKVIKNKAEPDVIIVRYKKTTYPHSNYKLIKNNEKDITNTEKLISYINKTKFPSNDCWSYAVKKTFCSKNKIYFPNIRFGENELFVVKIICLMKKYACFAGNFYFKNDRDFSLNHSKDFNTTISVLESVIELNIFSKKKSLSKVKKKFINNFIQDDFGTFSALLILRKNYEIKKLSNLLEKNKKNIKKLIKEPENINLYSLIRIHGSYKALLHYRKLIINTKIKLIKNLRFNYNHLYTYCRGKYAEATIKVLQESGYNIEGVIDDNDNFSKSNFLKYKTINSHTFFKKINKKLSKTAILITNQRIKTLNKISRQLEKNGVKKHQIVMIKY
jgi:glycosyltransferase involved in cell wall biosynthesis|tara:strand:+ start:1982 stop:3286 length:1305 start_codon:yes stop_codon:yes gene_type:complete